MAKIRDVILWPEFRVAWVLSAIVLVSIAIAAAFLPSPVSWVEVGLLAVSLILVFTSIYSAVAVDRGTSIERNEMKSILASVSDALIVYEKNFQAIFFDPAAERLFKLQAKDVLGHVFSPRDVEMSGWKTLAQVIFPSLAPRVIMRSEGNAVPQVVDISFADPQFEFRVTTAPVTDDHGNALAFLKIIRDRTAQIEALRSRSEFITVASHQLRGPVTDINWALQTLVSDAALDSNNKMIVDTAFAASQNLLRRIEDLLNIAKMEDGQFGYKFEDTDITSFVQSVLSEVLPAAQKTGVKIYFDEPKIPLPRVMIDPRRLSLALVNLLENAIRYNVENGEVVVKVDALPDKPFLVVSVKDTGIGIPPEAVEKLFTKFYRAENAMKIQADGSGLGLFIAKGIVAAHGGEIWVESELNRGTTVSFALPTDPSLVPKHEIGLDPSFKPDGFGVH